ncbi:Vinculin/alpha-catenin [Piromyces finnis]|uniref:Vinculin/alpha-catenin n=1 Tax=Piromyces finnis TaxID=1754191 RepID=A0A1Y1VD24_9FUNG|nr:Vinculin/alpha-catenin [Piromyces finnis]|eukprot:ORX53308.1 Vinculin/alpha-catenin [Piromyces finnis]
MNTITKKRILSPIVEVISELIILNEEVTENDSDFPDITNFANAVSKQIKQVVNVCYTYMNSLKEDEELQKSMPIGCEEVLGASELLIHSAELLKENSKSKEGRDNLVESIQNILSGITKVLDIYDEAEIRKIKTICKHIHELIDDSNQEKSVQESIGTLRQLSQCSMALATQIKNRIPELLSEQSQLHLRISIETISKITPLLLNSYKAMLKDSKSGNVLSSKDLICNILQNTCNDVDNIVSDTSTKTIETSKGGAITQKLEEVQNQQFIFQQFYSKKQYKEAFDILKKYLSSYNIVLDYIYDHLPSIYDSYQKQNINSTIGLLKRKEVDFKALMNNCEKSNYPYSLRNQLSAELEYRTEYLLYIKEQFNKSVISSIVTISEEIANHKDENSILGVYVQHTKTGDLGNINLQQYHEQQVSYFIDSQNKMNQLKKYQEIEKELNNSNDEIKQSMLDKVEGVNDCVINALNIYKNEFVFILKRVVNLLSTDNLQIHKDVILRKINTIDQFYPLIIKIGNAVNNNKDETNVNLFYDNVINTWEYLVNDVKSYIINQEGVFSMKDLLDSSSLNINGHIKALCRKDDHNIDDFSTEYKSILATVNQLVDISKNECNNTEDLSYRDKLKKSIKEIKNEMKYISKNVNNHEIKDSTRETFEKLNEALSAEDTSILISDMTFADLSQAPLQQREELGRLKFIDIKSHLTQLKEKVETLDQIIRINHRYSISRELPPTPPAAMKKSDKADYLHHLSPLSLNNSKNGGLNSPLSPLSQRPLLSPATPTRPNLRSQQNFTTNSAVGNTSFNAGNQSFYYQSPLADKNAIIQPMNKEDAIKNPIRAVACDLKMAASKWNHKDNLIIDKADIIAQKLDELSYYNQVIRSNPSAKKMLIRTAQDMMNHCTSILNYAKEICETCTDKRLKLQLLNTVERIHTIGQQLKVVVAVKSGSRFDMDGDKQLVTCASNLVEAVKSLLSDSEAACLRSNFMQQKLEEEEEEKEKKRKEADINQHEQNKLNKEQEIKEAIQHQRQQHHQQEEEKTEIQYSQEQQQQEEEDTNASLHEVIEASPSISTKENNISLSKSEDFILPQDIYDNIS